MDEIRTTRLFTFPTTGADKKLTQRLTNLCVSVTAMRLLSYTLVDFLKPYVDAKTWEDQQSSKKSQEEQEIANIELNEASKNANTPEGYSQGLNKVETKSNHFIQKLITICCGFQRDHSMDSIIAILMMIFMKQHKNI